MSNIEKKVVAVQVSPFKAVPDYDLQIELQPEGADEKTIGYCVCLRYEDKTFEIVEKKKYECDATAFAKDLCEQYQVYDWQVPYITPILETVRKSYPPTFEALKDKTTAWAGCLARLVELAWTDGIVLGINDHNGPVKPFPVLSGDYPQHWDAFSVAKVIDTFEVAHLKAPTAVVASSVAKSSIEWHDGGKTASDFTKRFIGQYMPRDLGPKGVITGIVIGDEAPDDLDGVRAEIIMAPEGSLIGAFTSTSQLEQMAVRGTDLDDGVAEMASSPNKFPKVYPTGLTKVRPDHPMDPLLQAVEATGVNQAQVDLMAGTNREVADTGYPAGGYSHDELSKAVRETTVKYGGQGGVVVITGNVVVEGELLDPCDLVLSTTMTSTLVENPVVSEDGIVKKDYDNPKLQFRTFETRGDHSPSKD